MEKHTMKKFVLIGAVLAIAVATFGLYPKASQAQYPPPIGSLTALASPPSATTGSNVTLTCKLQDATGQPVAGEACTIGISSEPGDDAAVGSKVVTKTTDSQGIATTNLYTGSSAGAIVISMAAAGVSGSVVVTVSEAASPPAAPLDGTISPPSTGDAGLADR
jgi:hypothetical protein